MREKEPLGDGLEWFFKNITDEELEDIQYFTEGNPFDRNGKYGPVCSKEEPYQRMKNHIKKVEGSHFIVSHHQSHAANAFFSSNYDEALIITIDGGGNEKPDWEDVHSEYKGGLGTSFTLWEGSGNKIKPIHIYQDSDLNLGAFYQSVTGKVFGMSIGHPYGFQGGTVMAMACMGDPNKYFDEFYKILKGNNTRETFDGMMDY